MAACRLLAAMACLLADTVHTRQGRKYEGKVLDYPNHVEVVPAEGKRVIISKADIEHVDIDTNLIECPEIVPYPFHLVERTDYDYVSFERTLVCLPRPPARKVVAFDIFPKIQKVWEIDLPNRVGDAVFCGRNLHLLQREEFLDDNQKYKVNKAPFSKKIHRLTVYAIDLLTGQFSWKLVVDNNDRKDLLWEFLPAPPTLLVTPERAVLRVHKTGWPMDSKGNVNKTEQRTFVTVYNYDVKNQKLVDAVDSTDIHDIRSRVFLSDDQIVVLTFTGGARFTLLSMGMHDGKVKWRSEEIAGRLHGVVGDQLYALDQTHLYAYSMKTGKKVDKWAVQHTDGAIEAIDHNYVYYYRRRQEPRAIIGYDTKKAKKAFEIPMPERDDYKHEMLLGHRLIYTDRNQTLRAFDTLQKKPLWEWRGTGTGNFMNLSLTGSALTFIKDGRIHHLDVNTGNLIWSLRGAFRGLVPVGDAGAVVYKLPLGMELLRRRGPPPEGARFFTASGTPLRFAAGEDTWSIPAFAGDMMYTIGGAGTCYAFDLKKKEIAWSIKLQGAAASAPSASGGRIAVHAAGAAHVYDASTRTKLFQAPDVATRPDREYLTGRGLLTMSGGGIALWDAAGGEKIWDSKARRVRDFVLAGKRAFALTTADIQLVDLESGETEDQAPVPANVTLMAVDGKRIFAAAGPLMAGETRPGDDFRELFRSPSPDPKVVGRFKGALAASSGRIFFSHAAGEVACIDADAKDETKRILWSFQTPEFTSPLLLAGGRLWFAAPGKGLFGLKAETGEVEWEAEVADPSAFTPFICEGKPAFWSNEGWMIQP